MSERIFITGPSDVRMDEQKIIESTTHSLIEEYPDAEFVFTSFPGTEFLAMNACLQRGCKVVCIFPWDVKEAHVSIQNLILKYDGKVDKRPLKMIDITAKSLFKLKQVAVDYATKVVVFHTDSVVDLSAFTHRIASITGKEIQSFPLFSSKQPYEGYFTPGGEPVKTGETKE